MDELQDEEEEHPPWGDAPREVLGIIIKHLPCDADRFRFGAVCRHWHDAESLLPRANHQRPWLVLSLPDSFARTAAYYSLSDKAVLELPFPIATDRSWARYCGSADGGWLVVARREGGGGMLCNPFTGAELPLPRQGVFPAGATGTPKRRGWYLSTAHVGKAVLSSPPDVSGGGCVVAAFISSSSLMVCRPGQSQRWQMVDAQTEIVDFIFRRHDNRLYGIDRWEFVHVFHVVLMDDGDTEDGGELAVSRVRVRPGGQEMDRVWARPDYYETTIHRAFVSRYLVESYRGRRLLMVLRYYNHADRRQTCKFRVMELEESGEHLCWTERQDLDGEVVFVGGSASRSLPASEHFRDKADADCIYFSDGRLFLTNEETRIDPPPRRDIGRYSMRDRSLSHLDVPAPHNRHGCCPQPWIYNVSS